MKFVQAVLFYLTNTACKSWLRPAEAVTILGGQEHTTVVDGSGNVLAAGSNQFGQLGLGDNTDRSQFTLLPSVSSIVSGCAYFHTVLVNSTGAALVVGQNDYGQLGLGDSTDRNALENLSNSSPLSGESVVGAACGKYSTLMWTSSGKLFAWGDGQYGLGSTSDFNTPQEVSSLNTETVVGAATDEDSSLAWTSDGKLFSWGRNDRGQLGLGHTSQMSTPSQVTVSGETIKSASSGSHHSIFVTNSGKLYSMGANFDGRLGTSASGSTQSSPLLIISSGVATAFAADDSNVVLMSDGSVMVFGDNEIGNMGTGDTNDVATPTQYPGIPSGAANVAIGPLTLFVELNNGTILVSGQNSHGELGMAPSAAVKSPVVFSTDIDECLTSVDDCHVEATCTNSAGSFTCACNTGFSGAGGVTCSDIDECGTSVHNCHTDGTCTNTAGSFTCACNGGYTGTGLACSDIDECGTATDNCNALATCTNTGGSFTCACNNGYSGDGLTCSDIDECGTATDNCNALATCTNTGGSFTCACNNGYSGDGLTCSDQDECSLSTHNCDSLGTCTNSDGSFACACNTGYSGDGISTCTADLIAELSESGGEVSLENSDPSGLMLHISVYGPDYTSMSAQTGSVSVNLVMNSADEILATPVRGEFRDTSPPTWQSLLGAIDREQTPFVGEAGAATGRRSLVLLTSANNPHPYAGDRTREGGFIVEGATRFVRVQARQQKRVVGSGKVPLVRASQFGASRAGGARSNFRRLTETSSWLAASEEDVRVSEEELKDGAGAVRIRSLGPDQSSVLEQRRILESDRGSFGLGIEGGEWILECAQVDVQAEVWTNSGRSYIPPPSHPPIAGDAQSASTLPGDILPGALAVLWLWVLLVALLSAFTGFILISRGVEKKVNPPLSAVHSKSSPHQKAPTALSEAKVADRPDGQLLSATIEQVLGSKEHRQRLSSFFSARRVVAFQEARKEINSADRGGQAAQNVEGNAGKGKKEEFRGHYKRLARWVSESPCAVCCRRLRLREKTLAFVDARRLSRLREVNYLQTSVKMKGYLESRERRQKLLWQQMDTELATWAHDLGLPGFRIVSWHRGEVWRRIKANASAPGVQSSDTFASSVSASSPQKLKFSSSLSSSLWSEDTSSPDCSTATVAPSSLPGYVASPVISPQRKPREPSPSSAASPSSPIRPPRWSDRSPNFFESLRQQVERLSPKNFKGQKGGRGQEGWKKVPKEEEEEEDSQTDKADPESDNDSLFEHLEMLKQVIGLRDDEQEEDNSRSIKEEEAAPKASVAASPSEARARDEKEKQVKEIEEEEVEIEDEDEGSPLVRKVGDSSTASPTISPSVRAFQGSRFFPSPLLSSRSQQLTDPKVEQSAPSPAAEEGSSVARRRSHKSRRISAVLRAVKMQRDHIVRAIDAQEKSGHARRLKWRSKMAIVAPQSVAKAGTLPLR
uniref:EGF-like domain-containing protein n=1 Tax=Chromera velia CCMP2878 TaxID=1169474 RepID=A0A0G4FK30_9ALVE|eukprot:Cvel_17434.t1-p1 / transcript=Cvel_17434.t1 / gene=Cvel_17434 / organism=Chromera_velia_CCMP2878 / gene_product=Fibrillin-1, putative / transcript_product=Fibrillin-1, putative / location=Cvel_scaffold1390:1780-16489(-) / protein_length=1443 / sequence_SO=supercontig / SO=protein_coding / is_pseudo=false